MKVILLDRVEHVGDAGDVVEVSDGYARNYLFPKELAAVASEGRQKDIELAGKSKKKAEQEEFERHQALAEKIDGTSVPITRKIGPEGKLFGSVKAKDVAEAIEQGTGESLPKGAVQLEEPLTELGETNVKVELAHGVEARVVVSVQAEEGSAEQSE